MSSVRRDFASAACFVLAMVWGVQATHPTSEGGAVRLGSDPATLAEVGDPAFIAGRGGDAEEDDAWTMLMHWNERARRVYNDFCTAEWNYATNLTKNSAEILLEKMAAYADFSKIRGRAFRKAFPDWRTFRNVSLRMAVRRLTNIKESALSATDYSKYSRLLKEMEEIYSAAAVCRDGKEAQDLDSGLTSTMSRTKDYDELLWAWKGWHDATGPAMRPKYAEFIHLLNKAAQSNGYENMAQLWQSEYETEDPASAYSLADDVERLYVELKPLYANLHLYVRNKLKAAYGGTRFPMEGHIPAHILGDQWAQIWQGQMAIVQPYDVGGGVDANPALGRKTIEEVFNITEDFFSSLGLQSTPPSFWSKSLFTKPADRKVSCHPMAYNFFDGSDVRIKMCATLTMGDFMTIHHEMGHVQYYLQYGHLPLVFQDGANPGFHEAIGDVIGMAAVVPKNLLRLGLIEPNNAREAETDINFLMNMALETVSALPFAKIVDEWRWSVFTNVTSAQDYNKKWWQLRCRYQGVSPPVPRSEEDFDPGALYHISANRPFVHYFISTILQFQIHRSLCKAANHTGPIHKCDIYGSKKAGELLAKVLKLGASLPWPDALQQITGVRYMDGSAILNYFQPLMDWLTEQNAGKGDPHWSESGCPDAPAVEVPTGKCTTGGTMRQALTDSASHQPSFSGTLLLLLAIIFVQAAISTAKVYYY